MSTDKGKRNCIIVAAETPSHKNLKFHIAHVDWPELSGGYCNAFNAMVEN